MKCHNVLRLDIIHREPPIQLAERSGIPSIAMRMESVGYTRREIIITSCGSQARYIEIGCFGVTAMFLQNYLNEFLRPRMMNESRLQFREDLHVLFHRHMILRLTGLIRCKCVLNQFLRKLTKGYGTRRGGKDKDLAII